MFQIGELALLAAGARMSTGGIFTFPRILVAEY
jgi:hypothetical protein